MRKAGLLALFFTLCIGTVSAGKEPALELLLPNDQSLHRDAYTPLVIKVNDRSYTDLLILSDDNRRFEMKLEPGRDVYCQSVPIHLGENSIRLKWRDRDGRSHEESRTLFAASPANKLFAHPPKSFSAKPFHLRDDEQRCIRCHDMSVNETPNVAFVDGRDSNCHTCHKALTAYPYGHAPAINWLCTACHKQQQIKGSPRFRIPETTAQECFSCHKENRAEWETKRFKHEPEAGGKCHRCHDSHASRNRYFLRQPVNTLCTGCHGEKSEHHAGDIVSVYTGSGERLCTDCHTPHASERAYLLNNEIIQPTKGEQR